MSQKVFIGDYSKQLTQLNIIIITCLLSVNQVLAQYQQQYGVPQQQAVPQQQPQQIHSYQNGQVQQVQQVQHQQQMAGQVVPHQHQVAGHVPQYQQQPQQGSNVLHDTQRIHDRQHIKEHLHGSVGADDLSKMSEEELQFHYFKMHDNDNNNKLDGSELIKSLIHWHVEESKHLGANAPPTGTTKIFGDQELEQMIDPILEMDDKNKDGYIDYPEFVAAQKARGF